MAITLLALLATLAADWPHWRGPGRNGASAEESGWDGKSWLADKPVWSINVGEGCTSPLVAGGGLFTLGWRKGKDHVVRLDPATGKEVWRAEYDAPRYGRHHLGDEGFYGGPTATPEIDTANGLLFTLGSDGALNAWRLTDGKHAWGVNLYARYKMGRRPKIGTGGQQRDYGYTAAPLLAGGALLVEAGGEAGTVVALDPRTGKHLWASEHRGHAGHSGAMAPIQVGDVPCVAVLTLRELVIIRLGRGNEGKTLASTPWATEFGNNIAGPAVHGSSVLVTSGYNIGRIARFTVSTDGIRKDWEAKQYSKACTPVVHDGHVYWCWQKVHCLRWKDGKQMWEGGGFSDPGSMIVTADRRLIVWGGQGRLALVETAARSHEAYTEVAVRARLAGAHAWPHVCLSNGRLFLKDRLGKLTALAVRNARP
jgi:outer membrane protein assembly factor BamB